MSEQRCILVGDWLANDTSIEDKALSGKNCSMVFSGIDNTSTIDDKRETLIDAIRAQERIDTLLFCIAPVDAAVIDELPESCTLLQRLGTGLDNVDIPYAESKGLIVRNTPNYCLEEVAVQVTANLLALHRQFPAVEAALREGGWTAKPPIPIHRLSTQTLGIAGFGRIGRKLGEIMKLLVKRIIYFDTYPGEPVDWAESVSFDELLQTSDLISIHMPLTDETRDIINKDTLSKMKETALFVNAARGALVNPVDISDALNNGVIAGAALDVFEPEILLADSPLREARNLILTSHTAWYSEEAMLDARVEAIESIVDHLNL